MSGKSSDQLSVRTVRGRFERSTFINFPWTIYGNDPLWIPPLKAAVRQLLDEAKHPFYEGGKGAEVEIFLAWDGERPVGRIAAIVNHNFNDFHHVNEVHFGFFECVDDQQTSNLLFGAVESWARNRGIASVVGPFNPSTNYECGLLIDGFDGPPVVMMTYNPNYYPELVEGAGYEKAKDLLAYVSPIRDQSLERLKKLSDRTKKRNPGLETRGADLKNFDGEVRAFQEIYNAAWQNNWAFVPLNDGEIKVLAHELKPLVEPGLLRFAFIDGEPAGFLLCLPDWNPVLGDLDGSPWRHPLKAIKHLLRTKASDMEGIRLITLGVKAEHRKRGLEGVLIAEGIEESLRLGYSWCEYSWILEDNELTKRAVRLMDGDLYKTYRIYQKDLNPDPVKIS